MKTKESTKDNKRNQQEYMRKPHKTKGKPENHIESQKTTSENKNELQSNQQKNKRNPKKSKDIHRQSKKVQNITPEFSVRLLIENNGRTNPENPGSCLLNFPQGLIITNNKRANPESPGSCLLNFPYAYLSENIRKLTPRVQDPPPQLSLYFLIKKQ